MTGVATSSPFDFTGRETDLTGLKSYRARYYHPAFHRFISEDPISFQGGDVNLYAYVANRPISAVDPLGLASGDWWNPISYFPDLDGARRIADEVLREAAGTGLPGAHNGPQDAWRHARWNQRMAEELGWLTAVVAGYGHELQDLFRGQPLDELLMDLHNNREGRGIANTGMSATDLLRGGRLRTINPPASRKCTYDLY